MQTADQHHNDARELARFIAASQEEQTAQQLIAAGAERPRPSQGLQAVAPGMIRARLRLTQAREQFSAGSRLRTFHPLLTKACPF